MINQMLRGFRDGCPIEVEIHDGKFWKRLFSYKTVHEHPKLHISANHVRKLDAYKEFEGILSYFGASVADLKVCSGESDKVPAKIKLNLQPRNVELRLR